MPIKSVSPLSWSINGCDVYCYPLTRLAMSDVMQAGTNLAENDKISKDQIDRFTENPNPLLQEKQLLPNIPFFPKSIKLEP
jgi:hypothetical protein